MTEISQVEHVAPNAVKISFSGPMRNDDELRAVANYVVPGGTIIAVEVEYIHAAPYVDPANLGGAPKAVYLLLAGNPYSASPITVGLTVDAYSTKIMDFSGNFLSGGETRQLATVAWVSPPYWAADGLRTREAFAELSRIGRT